MVYQPKERSQKDYSMENIHLLLFLNEDFNDILDDFPFGLLIIFENEEIFPAAVDCYIKLRHRTKFLPKVLLYTDFISSF